MSREIKKIIDSYFIYNVPVRFVWGRHYRAIGPNDDAADLYLEGDRFDYRSRHQLF